MGEHRVAWRCFVAIPIDEDLRLRLADAMNAWRAVQPTDSLRWTDPQGWHLTLAFIGWTDPARVPRLVRAIERVAAGEGPLTLQTGDLGAFPSPGAARVVWVGLEDPEDRLGRLALSLASALGSDATAPFRPHLTLARARGDRARVDLVAWRAAAAPPRVPLRVDRLILLRSHLGRGPARYEALAEVPLGVPVGA